MNVKEKERLIEEIKMQMTALEKINAWKKLAIFVSAVGVAIAYTGLSGTPSVLFPGILGICLTAAGFFSAAILNLGLKNGRRNVEKMINAVDGCRMS